MSGTAVMLRQMRHDVWATEQLVAKYRTLTPEQLELTVPGTYGSVRRTLAHIVNADEGYLVRLTGTLLHADRLDVDTATVDDIAAHLAHVKEGVEALFRGRELDWDRLIADTPARAPGQPRFETTAWVPATQFVHHGNDHRAQITTTLSAHGIEPPDVQVWPLATALGASRRGD